jgi:predicted NUDIX family NTP pyrophosphohydrolase
MHFQPPPIRAQGMKSAGLLVWRGARDGPEFLLVHPGGPFWRAKDLGAWSIPKGLIDPDEDPLAAARREFEEETGIPIGGDFTALPPIRQKGGKQVESWLVEADLDLSELRSNMVELEWPRGAGRVIRFPEVDRAAYFPPAEALNKILVSQRPILFEALARLLGEPAAAAFRSM